MKTKHHIQRITAAIVLTVAFIWLIVETESWLWLGIWCLVYLFISYLIIRFDQAKEIEDENMDL